MLAESSGVDSLSLPPAVANWIIGAMGALMLWERLNKIFGKAQPERREITGTVENKKAAVPADKNEVEKELEKLNAALAKLTQHIDTKLAAIMEAGQKRAETITAKIDAEMRTIRQETEAKVAELRLQVSAMMAKDAAHDEAIGTLKVDAYGVDNQIKQILSRLPKNRVP